MDVDVWASSARRRWTASRNAAFARGLARKALTPISRAASRSLSESSALMMNTEIGGTWARARRATASPSTPGSRRSVTTRSGASRSMRVIASGPVPAARQMYPRGRRIRLQLASRSDSSSTSRIFRAMSEFQSSSKKSASTASHRRVDNLAVSQDVRLGTVAPVGRRSPKRGASAAPGRSDCVLTLSETSRQNDSVMPADGRTPRGRPKPTGSRDQGPQRQRTEPLYRRAALADAVLESWSLGVVMVDGAGRIMRTNARLAEMFGYGQAELDGQSLDMLLPERLRAAHVRHRGSFFADPRVRPMGIGLELTARRKDGREFPVEISLSYFKNDEELVALGFVTDITPRRNVEQRLHAEFLVTKLFAEPDKPGDLVPRLLQALCESFAWDLGEFWRVDGDVLRYDSGWHRPELDTREYDAVSRATLWSRGLGLAGRVWDTGQACWVTSSDHLAGACSAAAARLGLKPACAFPVHGENRMLGAIVLLTRASREPDDTLLAMFTDIGSRLGQHLDHRRLELELRHQREVLFQSEKLSALGRLVAGVAHEMNNPLGIISSRIELMLGEVEGQGLSAQCLEDLKVIHRNVLRVAGVAKALRSFARQSTGEQRPIDLNAVVAETLLLVGKPMSTDNVRITTALDPALPALLGDANALQQVLLNLLTNAREALKGGGEISIRTGCDPARPGRLQLIVTDTGSGIPPAHLPHLFEPFYTTKPSGTGLGLALSYGIVQNHLGTIDVHSVEGQGATFTLSFPELKSRPGSP